MNSRGGEQGGAAAPEAGRIAVSVATTRGPVRILRIRAENPTVRSVICIDGTFSALPISRDYDAFVREPTGVIERVTAHPAYRVDVAAPIESGDSWHLGIYIAHMLAHEGRLAEKGEAADTHLLVTGSLDRALTVGAVSHVAEKLQRAGELRGQGHGIDGKPIFIFPAMGPAPEAAPGWDLRPAGTAAEALAPYSGSAEPGRRGHSRSRRIVVAGGILVGTALVLGGMLLWSIRSGGHREGVREASVGSGMEADGRGSIMRLLVVPRDPEAGGCGAAIDLAPDATEFDGDLCSGRVETRGTGEFLIRMSARGDFSTYVDDARYHRELLGAADGGDSVSLSLGFPYWVRREFVFEVEVDMLSLDGAPTRRARRSVLVRPARPR